MNPFAEKIISWYMENRRDLPWRDTKDPYKIWISEIILQQTRVAQGYDYYVRFIRRFPDVKTLAEADEDEVMKYWQGLGYYSRCRNLHAAAKEVAAMDRFPDTYEAVRKLKGVGDYTAAAICSFAYGMPCAVVDGNVYRVLSRWMGVEDEIDSVAGKRLFARLADEMMDKSRPALYNQAIMDFGALQCVPSAPGCLLCPLSDSCVALQKGTVGELPRKGHRQKVTDKYYHYFFVRCGEDTFLRKRGAGDIWQNLYEPPLIESDYAQTEEALVASDAFATLFRSCCIIRMEKKQEGVKHVLSHRCIHAMFFVVEVGEGSALGCDYIRIPINDVDKFPVSRLVSRFFSLILSHNH